MKLLINGGILEVTNDAGLIISANNPLEFKFGKAHKTYTINIPNTANNNFLLKNLWAKNVFRDVNFEGFAIINDVYLSGVLKIFGFADMGAQGVFVSGAGKVWETFKDKKLSKFDFAELEHVLNWDNATSDVIENAVIYDYIYRGAGLIAPTTVMQNVDIAELQPAIRVKYILDKIFDGWTITQNAMSTDDFNSLFLPFCKDFIRNTSGWLKDGQASAVSNNGVYAQNMTRVGQVYTHTFINLFKNLSNYTYDAGTYKYTATELGSLRHSGRVILQNFGFNPENVATYDLTNSYVELEITLVSGATTTTLHRQRTVLTQIPDTRTYDYSFDLKTVEYPKDSVLNIKVFARLEVTAGDAGGIGVGGTIPTTGLLKTETWQWLGFGSLVTPEYILPDWTATQFIEAILKQFNMDVFISYERSIIFFTSRYVVAPTIYDITTKALKNSANVSTLPDPPNFSLEYREDRKDVYFASQVAADRSNGNTFVDNGSTDTKTIQMSFAYTMMRDVAPLIPQMTIAVKAPETVPKYTTAFVQRLLHYRGRRSNTFTLHSGDLVTTGVNIQAKTGVITSTHWFSNENNDQTNTLDFTNEGAKIGLFKRFYEKAIERLTEGTIVEISVEMDKEFFNSLYYLQGMDLRARYLVQVDGIRSYYQIIEAEKETENIYRLKMYLELL